MLLLGKIPGDAVPALGGGRRLGGNGPERAGVGVAQAVGRGPGGGSGGGGGFGADSGAQESGAGTPQERQKGRDRVQERVIGKGEMGESESDGEREIVSLSHSMC